MRLIASALKKSNVAYWELVESFEKTEARAEDAMSKVLFLVNHEIAIYYFRLEIVERLLADGQQVLISSPPGELIEKLKAMGCEHHPISLERHGTNPIRDFILIQKYKRLLKKTKPDVVFSFTIKPNIYGAIACRSRNIPCVVNITGLGTAIEYPGIVQKIGVLLYKYAFTKVKRVFFQNEENRRFFVERNIAVNAHELLPGSGVNLQRFAPLEYPSDETIEFVFIARIMKEKGIDQYLEAAERIRAKYPQTRFHICGFCEQAYEEKLKDLTDKGVVVYHGMVRDVKPILERVHCVVHPTYYPEGLSNVLLEGAATARPLITTDRAGCREVIDDGVNGFVVKQKDSADLIEKIEKFLALPWEKRRDMGLAGRAKVEREFDRQIVVDKYSRIVDEFCGENRGD